VIAPDDAWRTMPRATEVVRRAIAAAAAAMPGDGGGAAAVVCVLLCDDATIAGLNGRWRGIARPTNVLSFPAPADFDIAADAPLGDIAIAAGTLTREAAAAGKTVEAHLAHLAVHGFLHLIGHDHDSDEDAEAMEQLERDILARIGVADPHAAEDVDI
jgi:probable rRNA maturation factor